MIDIREMDQKDLVKRLYQSCIQCKRVKIRVLRDRLVIGQIKELGDISLGQIKIRRNGSELGKIN